LRKTEKKKEKKKRKASGGAERLPNGPFANIAPLMASKREDIYYIYEKKSG
jgi:hypothetical protein